MSSDKNSKLLTKRDALIKSLYSLELLGSKIKKNDNNSQIIKNYKIQKKEIQSSENKIIGFKMYLLIRKRKFYFPDVDTYLNKLFVKDHAEKEIESNSMKRKRKCINASFSL